MRVLAVHVALPAPSRFGSHAAPSSFDKELVDGPVAIGALGLAGDGRAARRAFGDSHHAVYAYPQAHYGHWERVLSGGPLRSGAFAENLTVDGPLETEARIGDRIRCGSALLEVAQPRIPCFKLKARLGLASKKVFLESRRVGYYLRVLEEGEVRAGDRFEIVDSDGRSPTIDDFVRITQVDYWDADALQWSLSARGLVPGWADVIAPMLERARAADGWFGTRELEVAARVEEGGDAVSLTLRCPDGRALPRFAAGRHLTLDARLPDRPVARRRYFLSGDPNDHERYRITVARREPIDDGDASVSEHLCDARVGDRFRASAPRGGVVLDAIARESAHLLVLSEGVGIAPVVGLLHEATRSRPRLRVTVSHRASAEVPLRAELDALARAHPTIALRGALAGEGALDAVRELEPFDAVFLFGSAAHARAAREALAEAGWTGPVHEESWGA